MQRALNLALADRRADDGMNDLFVEEVSPAPDCGHLLVHVIIPADRPVTEALGVLRRDAPRLRSEVAMAITRKRAPELSFAPGSPVSLEHHGGRKLWVHRKGAMPAALGQAGVLPGSMGSTSFHVEGRGHEAALCSSAHGAGRALSRTTARATVTDREFRRQMEGVWYDFRLSDKLRDEAPAAYKDIKAVLRAQRELVKVRRVLRPVLNYKGV